MKTTEAARGRWYGILTELGIPSHHLTGKHGPCPLCGEGKDRFRWDNKDGAGTYFCSQCGAGDGMKFALHWSGMEFKDLAAKIDGMIGNIPMDKIKPRPKGNVTKLFKRSQAGGAIVRRYLEARGLAMPQYIGECPNFDYWEIGDDGEFCKVGTFPAMVAAIRDDAGKPIGAHVTVLDGSGKAAVSSPKKIYGELPVSAAARLYDPTPTLGIAEGIETAISAYRLFGVNTWAALNTALLEKFNPPEGTERLIIYGDHDFNYAGHKAAYTLAHRVAKMGIRVHVKIPEEPGTDWNDVLLNGKDNNRTG